jgi:hypothetical protein
MEYNSFLYENEGEWVSFGRAGASVMKVITITENASGEYERPRGECVIMEGDDDADGGLDFSAAVYGLSDNDFLE